MNSLKKSMSSYEKETNYDLLEKQMSSPGPNGCCHKGGVKIRKDKWTSRFKEFKYPSLKMDNPKDKHKLWGCLVVLGSFITHLIIGGLERSNGVIYLKLVEEFERSAVDTAWVVSLSSTARLLLGPVASALCNRFSCRIVAISGGLILAVGFFITSHMKKIEYLYVSFGVIGGVGKSFAYTPSVVIVTMYFENHKSTAFGVASAGSGLGMLVVPPILQLFFTDHDFYKSMLILVAVAPFLCFSGSLYRSPPVPQPEICLQNNHDPEIDSLAQPVRKDGEQSPQPYDAYIEPTTPTTILSMDTTETTITTNTPLKDTQDVNENIKNGGHLVESQESVEEVDSRVRWKLCHLFGCCNKKPHGVQEKNYGCCARRCKSNNSKKKPKDKKVLIDWSLLKDPLFLIFGSSLCLFTLGSQSSAVFVPALGKEKGLGNIQAAYLISILGVADALAKISAGFILDCKPVQKYRRFMYNINVFLIAILIILCPFMETFTEFGILCAVYGVLNGINVSQKAVMLTELLGQDRISSSFGLTICFQGLGALSGPPLSGLLKDKFQSYNEPFYFIASVVIAGACVMVAGNMYHSCQSVEKASQAAAAAVSINMGDEQVEGEHV